METLLMGCLTDPDMVSRLLDTVTQSAIRYGEVINDIGVDGVFIEGSTAGGEMMDPSMFQQFDGQYLVRFLDSCRANSLRTLLHNCSEKPLWKEHLETRPTAFHLQLSVVSLPEVAEAMKGKTCFIAGVEHRDLLLNRTPAEVTAEVKSALEAWGQEPGLIMGPGCEFPYKVPVENIKAFKESVERYGKRQ
jgi:uroporphyrinogen-III decarboxylase